MRAIARLLGTAANTADPGLLERVLVREVCAIAGVGAAILLDVDDRARRIRVAARAPSLAEATEAVALDELPALRDAIAIRLPRRLDAAAAADLARLATLDRAPATALLLPAQADYDCRLHALVLAADREQAAVTTADLEAGAAFAAAGLGQLNLLERHRAQVERQSALARAAKALNESLDLTRVLPRICDEAAAILGADSVCVYRGSAASGLVLEASNSTPELIGARVEPGAGISGRAIEVGHALLTNEYQGDAAPPPDSPFAGVRSALAAPMRWDGELRGVLWVGFLRERRVTEDDLALLENFAELAAVACRNASVHAGLAEAARKDPLTGCLNHAALHETLRREMQRSRRTGRRLSIVMVDLDHFKQVNERHGHLVGDEFLRRVARGLREAVRPYDFVARYGGDEFAIVAVDADEARAIEIADRALGRIGPSLASLVPEGEGPHATAGVAEWRGAAAASDVVRQADRALLFGKQRGIRGAAIGASVVPDEFVLGLELGEEPAEPSAAAAPWPSAVRRETEPLRRRSQLLSFASELGARVSGLVNRREIAEVAAAELVRAFELDLCAVVARERDGAPKLLGASGRDAGGVAASEVVLRCLDEARPVLGDIASGSAREPVSALALPLIGGAGPLGALVLERRAAFPEPDVRLCEAIAHQLAGALRAAAQYEQLERDYVATAEALAGAVESGDAYEPGHARAIADRAEAVGRQLGMSADELSALRFAAVLHDIGKLAVPRDILAKSGPLTDAERHVVERHTVAGEQILASVDSLSAVRPLLRHCHERWDGRGYPDGLAGERIPSGARVLLVCDAHAAMTSDRPYRRALTGAAARAELAEAAGTQFDARVVDAFFAVAGGDEG